MQNKTVYADGFHDDTKALQAYLDELKDGGTVYFPDGIYLISAALIFYSDQYLRFSDKAVLLRNAKSGPISYLEIPQDDEPCFTADKRHGEAVGYIAKPTEKSA